MIEEIIKREYAFLDKVENIGGRANCQDNYEVFYIHRKAQYDNYNEETLSCFLQDLKQYEKINLNPMMLKYAYMMETSDPIYFNQIKDKLPTIDNQTKKIINELVAIELEMVEECNLKHPKFASISRDVNTTTDTNVSTSFETYLRGELSTYSPTTLVSYAKMIIDMKQHNINFILNIRNSSAIGFGYHSIDDAESKI